MTDVLTRPPDQVADQVPPFGFAAGDPGVSSYAGLFEQQTSSTRSAAAPEWLGTLRRRAMTRFTELGFPTTKDEDWHFTSVAPIASRTFGSTGAPSPVAREDLAPFLFGDDWHTLVFVNGVLVPSLSCVEGVDGTEGTRGWYVGNFPAALVDEPAAVERYLAGLAPYHTSAFTALNTAFLHDGAVIVLRPGTVVDRPVHLVFVADANANGALVSPRTLVVAGRHAEAAVVESYVSLGGDTYFTNAVTELYLAPGARLKHYKVQRESVAAYHVGASYAYQQDDSHYESFSFATGADLSRTNISTVLDGPGAHATVNGLYVVDGTQTVDHQTRIEHARERCTSHEVYKGILDGEAHAVFNGKVYVRPEAQKTDGKQSNNNLLLSDRARVDTKPQLEIFADDVKCTHGATVGRLDETALFYLKSRGVGPELARRLLTYAFAAGVLEELTVDPVRRQLERLTFRRFGVGG